MKLSTFAALALGGLIGLGAQVAVAQFVPPVASGAVAGTAISPASVTTDVANIGVLDAGIGIVGKIGMSGGVIRETDATGGIIDLSAGFAQLTVNNGTASLTCQQSSATCTFAGNLVSNGATTFSNTTNFTAAVAVGGAAWNFGTSVTVSGFCSSPSVVWSSGTAAFEINVGTSCAGSTGTVNFSTVLHGYACQCENVTNTASRTVGHGVGTTATNVLTNYSRTTGIATNWADSDHVRCLCGGG